MITIHQLTQPTAASTIDVKLSSPLTQPTFMPELTHEPSLKSTLHPTNPLSDNTIAPTFTHDPTIVPTFTYDPSVVHDPTVVTTFTHDPSIGPSPHPS